MKIAGVPDDAIRLNLFSFSLAGEAKRWLHSFKGNSLRTWEEVVDVRQVASNILRRGVELRYCKQLP